MPCPSGAGPNAPGSPGGNGATAWAGLLTRNPAARPGVRQEERWDRAGQVTGRVDGNRDDWFYSLDLVALGTAPDIVPLLGENRVIAKPDQARQGSPARRRGEVRARVVGGRGFQ